MSGLTLKTKNDAIFLSVKHHCLCEESKSLREGFREIQTKNPKNNEMVTKFIREFDSVEGFVTKIEWYDTKKQYDTRYLGYRLHIDADGQPVVLDLPFKTRPYDTFALFAENIDWKKKVKFSAWHDRKDDVTAFIARQGEAVVKRKYTKDNPGECPPAVHDEVDGWDFKDQRKWLKARIDTIVIPAVAAAEEQRTKVAEKAAAAAATPAALDPKKAALKAQAPLDDPDDGPPLSYPDDDEVPF